MRTLGDALQSQNEVELNKIYGDFDISAQYFPELNEGNVVEQLRSNTALQETLRDYYRKYEDRDFGSVDEMIDHLYTSEAFQRHNDVGIAFKMGEAALADNEKKQYLSLVSRIYSALPTNPMADGGSWSALGAMVAGEVLSPTNLIGAGVAGRVVGRTAAKEVLEAGLREGVREGFESAATREALKSGIKSGAAADLAINTATGAGLSLMEQGRDVELALRDDTSLLEAGIAGVTGGALGAAVGGIVGGVGAYRGAKELLGEAPEIIAKHDAVVAEAAAKAEAEAAAAVEPEVATEPVPALQTVDPAAAEQYDFIRSRLSDFAVAVREDSNLASHLGRVADERTISDLMARADAAKSFPSENASLAELMAKAERDAAELAAAGDHTASIEALRTREQYKSRIDANDNFSRALNDSYQMLTSAGPDDERAILGKLLAAAEQIDAAKGIEKRDAPKVEPEAVNTAAAAPAEPVAVKEEAQQLQGDNPEAAPAAEVDAQPAEIDPLEQVSAIERQLDSFTQERDTLLAAGNNSPEVVSRISALEGAISQAQQVLPAIRQAIESRGGPVVAVKESANKAAGKKPARKKQPATAKAATPAAQDTGVSFVNLDGKDKLYSATVQSYVNDIASHGDITALPSHWFDAVDPKARAAADMATVIAMEEADEATRSAMIRKAAAPVIRAGLAADMAADIMDTFGGKFALDAELVEGALIAMDLNAATRKEVLKAWRKLAGKATDSASGVLNGLGEMIGKGMSIEQAVDEMIAKLGSKDALVDALHRSGLAVLRMDFSGMKPDHVDPMAWKDAVESAARDARRALVKMREGATETRSGELASAQDRALLANLTEAILRQRIDNNQIGGDGLAGLFHTAVRTTGAFDPSNAPAHEFVGKKLGGFDLSRAVPDNGGKYLTLPPFEKLASFARITKGEYLEIVGDARLRARESVTAADFKDPAQLRRAQDAYAQMLARAEVEQVVSAQVSMAGATGPFASAIKHTYTSLIDNALGDARDTLTPVRAGGYRAVARAKIASLRQRGKRIEKLNPKEQGKERAAVERGILSAQNQLRPFAERQAVIDTPTENEGRMAAAAQIMKAIKDGKISRDEGRAAMSQHNLAPEEEAMADGLASVLKRLEAYASMREKVAAEAKEVVGTTIGNTDFRAKFAQLRVLAKTVKVDLDALTAAIQSYEERAASKELKAAQVEAKRANRVAKKAGAEPAKVPHAADEAVAKIQEINDIANPVLLVKTEAGVFELPQGRLHVRAEKTGDSAVYTVRPAARSKTGYVITAKTGEFSLARTTGEVIGQKLLSIDDAWEAIAGDEAMAKAVAKMKGLSVSPAKEGGTIIEHAISQTAADEAAVDGMVGRALTDADMASTPSSFAGELPAGWLVALRNSKSGEVRVPSKLQQDSPLSAVIGKGNPDDWTVGQVSAAPGKKGNSRATTFRALGDAPAIAEDVIVPNAAAAAAATRRVPVDKLSEIALSTDAISRIKAATGMQAKTALDLHHVIQHLETTNKVASPQSASQMAAQLGELYALRSAAVPNGIHLPTAAKRDTLAQVRNLFSSSPAPVVQEVTELIRRLAGDRAPEVAASADGWEYGIASNKVGVAIGSQPVPDHIAFTHEVGHWSYFNLLTDEQRVDFWNWYAAALNDGTISEKGNSYTGYDFLNGGGNEARRTMPAEVFADAFAQYVTSAHSLYREAAPTFWQSVIGKVSKVLDYMLRFIGVDGAGSSPKLLDDYFDPVQDKALLDIMRAILPEEVAPSRYLLSPEKNGAALAGNYEGKERVEQLLHRAGNLDEHRVKIDRMLRDGSAISVDEFAAALKAASAQVYGVLFSPDNRIAGLKSRLPSGASREKEATWLLSGSGSRGQVMGAVYALNKNTAQALARAEEGGLADVADGTGTNMSALAGLVDEKFFNSLVDLLRDADYGSSQEKFADVKRLLEKAGVDADEADAIAAELIDDGFSYSARVAHEAAAADTSAEFSSLVPLAQEVIGALLDAQTGLARLAGEYLPEGATIRIDRVAARRPITDRTGKDKVVAHFKRIAKAVDTKDSDARALRIAQLVQREEPANILNELAGAFAEVKRKNTAAKWTDLSQNHRDLMTALSVRANLMDTIEPPAGKSLGDMPEEIASLVVNDQTANIARNALQRGDVEKAQWVLVRIQQERGAKVALPSLNDDVMGMKGYKSLKSAALKMDFATDIGEALARELSDRAGSGIQFGLPQGVRDDIAMIARDITHRDPMLEQVGHTIAYRALNMLDTGPLVSEADIGRLTGHFGLASQQAGRNSLAYNHFRRVVRNIATATQQDGAALAQAVAEMTSNLVGRTDAEFVAGVAAYLKDGKGIASRLDVDGAEAFNRATEAAEYLLSGLPIKADGFLAVKMRGNDIDPAGLRVLESLDALTAGTAKARFSAAVSRAPRAVRADISRWAGASPEAAGVFLTDIAATDGAFGRGIYLMTDFTDEADHAGSALAAEAVAKQAAGQFGEAPLAYAAAGAGNIKARIIRPDAYLDMEKVAAPEITSVMLDRVAELGGDVSAAAVKLAPGSTYGQLVSALSASIPTSAPQRTRLLNEIIAGMGFDGIRSGPSLMAFKPESIRALEDFAPVPLSDDRVPMGGEVLEAMATTGVVNTDPNAIAPRTLRMNFGAGEGGVLSKLLRRHEVSPEEAAAPYKHKGWIQLSTGSARMRKAGLNYLADFIAPETGTALQARVNARVADFLYNSKGGIFAALDKVSKVGGVKAWVKSIKDGVPSYSKAKGLHWIDPAQEPHEARVVDALRKGDLSGLNAEELALANQVNDWFRNMLDVQRAAGLNVGDATKDGFNKFYMPQLWSEDAMKQDFGLAVEGFAKFFLRENSRLRGIDPDTGARIPAAVAPSQLPPLSLAEARDKAERLVRKMTADADTGTILPSGVGGYKDIVGEQYFSRLLRLNGTDLEATGLHAFMHNNLRGIVAKYADAAARRIEWNAKFGDKHHGLDAYLNTIQGGAVGAIDVLTSAKTRRMTIDAYAGDVLEVELEKVASLPPAAATQAVQSAALAIDAARNANGFVSPEGIAKAKAILMNAQPYKSADYERRVDAIVAAFADKGSMGMALARDEMKFVVGQMNALQRKPIDNGTFTNASRHFAKNAAAFNAITRLGFATLGSLPDMAMPLVRSGNFKAWATAWSNYMKDPDYRAAAKRMGTSMESILFESMSHFYGDGLGRVSQAFFNANLMTPWTKTMREVAAMVAIESFKTEQAVVQRLRAKGDFGPRYQSGLRYLRQHGLAHMGELGAPRLDARADFADSAEIRRAVQQFCDDTIFAPSQNDVPLWGQTPWGHLVFQFKTFPMMFGRFVKHHIIGEARKGNYRPLGMALTALPAFGALSVATRDVVQGRADNDEDKYKEHAVANRSLAKMLESYGISSEVSGAMADDNDFLGWYLDSLIKAGGLGLVGDLAFNVLDQSDNGAYGTQRMISLIGGPTAGAAVSTWNIANGGITAGREMMFGDGSESGNDAEQRTAVREMAAMLPILGGVGTFKDAVTDAVVGPRLE